MFVHDAWVKGLDLGRTGSGPGLFSTDSCSVCSVHFAVPTVVELGFYVCTVFPEIAPRPSFQQQIQDQMLMNAVLGLKHADEWSLSLQCLDHQVDPVRFCVLVPVRADLTSVSPKRH